MSNPIRVRIDDKPRPSWMETDEDLWMYEQTCDLARKLGFDALSCGWTMLPKPRGSFSVSRRGTDLTITVTGKTPMDAVANMDWLLGRIE